MLLLASSLLPPGPAAAADAACPEGAARVAAGDSIQAAALRVGPGGTVCLGPGRYRMQTVVPLTGQSFLGAPGSVLDGARPLGPFVREGKSTREGKVWSAPLPPRSPAAQVGSCLGGGAVCTWPALFLDGQPLARSAPGGPLAPGQYRIDPARWRVQIADDPAGRTLEVAATRFAFRGTAAGVRLRGLVVEKYDSPPQMGAVEGAGDGWRIESCEIRFNGGVGVGVGANGTVRDSLLHHNGQLGATAGGRRILFENNRIAENNTAGFDPDWEAGGLKITESTDVVLRGNHVARNRGPGLWCDIDCRDVLFEGNRVERNDGPGIFYEISARAVVRNNTLRLNGQGAPGWYWGAEIQIAASEGVEVTDNDLTVRPEGNAIILVDQAREKGKDLYRTADNRVHANRITFTGPGSAGGVSDAEPDSPNYRIIQAGANSFDRNVYRAPAGSPPGFIWGHEPLEGLAAFRANGQERAGSLSEAAPEAAP